MVKYRSADWLWRLSPSGIVALNWLVTASSVALCMVLLLLRLPGMQLAGVGPNWLMIWVVAWSMSRTAFWGTIAGLVLGLMQDGMTAHEPTHALSLALVGYLTARLQKQRYIQEDLISVALIAFGMAVVAETVMAIQFSLLGDRNMLEIWVNQQHIAIASAILSSLWAPVVAYPLNRWWEQVNIVRRQIS